ncbi:MAG: DUF4935 domain-containing protein [Saprospiraceae bacterium]|nr:DUF4935 domain-containing protein [Saprospiraceae bacterium]
MGKQLKTDIVFIDTSVFVNENFLHGNKIKELKKYGGTGYLKIKIIDITYNEVLKKMKEFLEKAKSKYKQVDKTLQSQEIRILKNIERYTSYFSPIKIDIEKEFSELKRLLDNFIDDANIEIISSDFASIKEVFDKYFMAALPFENNNEKKNEFPDAFVLNAIEKWCMKFNKKVILLSNDNGMKNYQNKIILTEWSLSTLVDNITRLYEKDQKHQQRIDRIDQIMNKNRTEIKSDLKGDLSHSLSDFLHDSLSIGYIEVENIDLLDIEGININEKYNIISADENDAYVEIMGGVDFSCEITYFDKEDAFYDKEDDMWFGEEEKTLKLKENINFKSTLIINHTPLAGEEFAGYGGIEDIEFLDEVSIN